MKPDLNKLLQVLLENNIDFVLIGGFAGALHGSSLVTKDLDICALLTPSHIENLRRVLKPLEPKHRMTPKKLSFLEEPKDISNVNNLYLETNLGILDIISDVIGVGGFETVSSHAIEIPLFGRMCKVISIEDLIAAKTKMGRAKDIAAVRELKLIKEKSKSK